MDTDMEQDLDDPLSNDELLSNKDPFSTDDLFLNEDALSNEDPPANKDAQPDEEYKQNYPYKIEPFSCVHHLNKEIKFPLLPIAINQELKIIRLILIHKWKFRFINELNGFLYYFENLELLDSDCEILDDLPFVYYRIRADFYLFRPKVGEYLKAKISWYVLF